MASRYNHCSISNRIKSRLEKCRKGPASAKGTDEYLHEEPSRTYTFDEGDEDNHVSSTESVSCLDDVNYPRDTGDIEHHYRSRKTSKDAGSESPPFQSDQRRANYYDSYEDYHHKKHSPDKIREYPTELAIEAMQRLQQLKELQRRRDYNEKYYDQEIKRLIAESQCLGIKSTSPVARSPEKFYAGDHRTLPNLSTKLEPCGTMTTITRLDCGCVEQMTRPIFTTPGGQVKKRSCALEQQVHVRLSAPNADTRFVVGGNHSHSASTSTRLKSRSFNDSGVTATVTKPDPKLILQQKLNSQGNRKAPSEISA